MGQSSSNQNNGTNSFPSNNNNIKNQPAKKASTYQQLEADVAQANKISSKYKDKEGRCLLFVLNNPDDSPTVQRKHRNTTVNANMNMNTTVNANMNMNTTVNANMNMNTTVNANMNMNTTVNANMNMNTNVNATMNVHSMHANTPTNTPHTLSPLAGTTPLPSLTPHPEGHTPLPDLDKTARDEPILWRLRTTISVLKHPAQLGADQRLLNYRQFYRLYFRMREYGSIDDVTKDEIRSSVTINEFDENECVICMESRAQIALNCNHAFCERCLQQWKQRSDTCPVCRQLNSTDENDVWVLTDEPSTEDLANYFSEFLDSICK